MVVESSPYFTVEEYLEFERNSEIKHEYINGQIHAMSDGSPNHSRLAGKVNSLLDQQLSGHPCEPFNSDQRIAIVDIGATYYPDVSVGCPPLEYAPNDAYALTNPTVIVEVLSPSTAAFDRGDKFLHYRRIPSLQDYVLVAQDAMRLEHFSRQPDGNWLLHIAEKPDDIVELSSVDCRLTVSTVYERVEFPPPGTTLEPLVIRPHNDDSTARRP